MLLSSPVPRIVACGYFTPVRTLSATALLLLACGFAGGCADSSSRPSGAGAPPSVPGGPDAVVLRVARSGGTVSAYAYPALDSVLWKSGSRSPALDHVIAFGPEDGYLAALDTSGAPVRLDLRLGEITAERKIPVATVSSADGGALYALTREGALTRFTPSGGDWSFAPPLPASALFAQGDGSLIVAGVRGDRLVVWRVRPPGQTVEDSISYVLDGDPAAVMATLTATAGTVGDRLFFGANESVVVVRQRDMQTAQEIDLGDPVTAIVATPSGDRLFVALADDRSLRILDRFEDGVSGRIRLPSAVTALRMDPLGRVLLARGAADTVYVVSLATDEMQGVVRSDWRGDLPLVLPDGAIALARDADVIFADASSLADGRIIAGGTSDFWHVLRWNGFRPRAAGLDEPVRFRASAPRDPADYADALPTADSTSSVTGVSGVTPPTGGDTLGAASRGAGSATPPVGGTRTDSGAGAQFTVSFAALLDEKAARALAAAIRVNGQAPRITTSDRAGRTLYRVVMGPYPSREDAEQVGRASAHSYWVFRGAP